ncbi:MAG: PAS domain-containing protein [Melioribacteraceae bacterium]|nr:PAS domain-containing protein [Melioribacteraceae bacterium]
MLPNGFIYVSCRDISERKEIQKEIEFQSDLLYNVGQSVIATDLQGNVIYWNHEAEKIYGWTYEEAMGQNIVNLTPAQQTKGQAIEIMKELSKGNTWSGEFFVKRKDGTSFQALVTDAPITDTDGKLIGIIGISSDITERKHAQEELLKLSRAVEQSPSSIIITDTEGDIEYINPKVTEITGYRFAELIGENPRIFSSGEKPKSEYKELWATITSGKNGVVNVIIKRKTVSFFRSGINFTDHK